MNFIKSNKISHTVTFLLFLTFLVNSSCKKILDIPPSQNRVSSESVFSTDELATSAVLGIYSNANFAFPSFSSGSITILTGLSSDELSYTQTDKDYLEFATNSISPKNGYNSFNMWERAYKLIYQTNICIDGLMKSSAVTDNLKNQLMGECMVFRSMMYFYLTNVYGDVPFTTSTDYAVNAKLSRKPVSDINVSIEADLLKAKSLLSDNYPSTGKYRINKYVATAFLSKFYLYQKKWAESENEATEVIASGIYNLAPNPNDAFLINSPETLCQLLPVLSGFITAEGFTFIPYDANSIPGFIITDELVSEFEDGDLRNQSWIKTNTINGKAYNYPTKYKQSLDFSGAPAKESYSLIRLSEVYLIRAEARINLHKISEGIDDINIVRSRSRATATPITPDPLPNVSNTISQSDAMTALIHERRIELLAEWGSRWFDLKRWDIADDLLKNKSGWQATDVLFPIPNGEISLNPNLTQNNGYN
jgi:starch-binding outer membrane protein, SusD/RagB family